ncbi:N-acetyltransferase [Rouxiella sp. T17]|uniref:GNAT family N-acetyltransferase n=1 Tax=Rouxiella sp. T17 TaxID=3085684 RepID=UPI002FC9F2A9
MLIRVEIPVDAARIDQLLRQAFGRDDEADLVQRLREDGLLTLGIVATDDEGGVAGYAAFTPVDVHGEDRQWVALGPLAVEASQRGQKVGEKLIYEGLDALNEFGYAAVVVQGAPDYFARFGFKPAAAHQLHSRWPDSEKSFQLYVLADNALEDASGLVEYPPHFNHN